MKQLKYSIIGYPLKHSLSPFIHKNLFEISGVNAVYDYLEINPDDFESKTDDIKSLNGANVTIPYKTKIIDLMDELDPRAEIYGAVNTISNKNGKHIGYNTDCFGFLRSLESENVALSGNTVVCGCGGVSRMMAYECVMAGATLTIAIRKSSFEKANLLKNEILGKYPQSKINICLLDELDFDIDLLINGTPVGMFPNTQFSPVNDDVLKKTKVVFDSIYNPENTLLMKKAQALGAKTIGGMPMLVWQAVAAQEIWHNIKFKKDDVLNVIDLTKKELLRRF